MRGSSLSLKRVDYQDSHPGQANMLLLHTYIIDGCPSKSNHPFLKKRQAEQYKSSSAIKIPLLLPQTDLRRWICWVRKSSHFSVVGGTGRGTRMPRAQGAAALTEAPLVWQSGTANRISLLWVLRWELRKCCGTLHLKEELDLVLSERERRFK